MNTIIETATGPYECDTVWRDERLNVELDGRGSHATAMAFEKDRRRDRALIVAGWQPMRVTWLQLLDEPEAVVADIRALLAERGRRTAA